MWFFRGLPVPAGQGKRQKRKKHVLESVVFSWFAGTAPTWRQGKRQKRKKHVLESVVFSWFACTGPYVTHVEAREEAKNKKPRFRKHAAPMSPAWGKRKNHVLESVVFSWFARTGPYVTHVEAREEAKMKKTVLENVFFVVCPCGPLCPCADFVHFEVQNPMHCYICIAILFPLLADYCASTCIAYFACSFLKSQVHFSRKRVTI